MCKKYILAITSNFSDDYVCEEFMDKDEAINTLNSMLLEEVQTVRTENEYDPTVIHNTEDDITLIYKSDARLFDEAGNRICCDMAFYRVMEIE